MIKRVLSVSLGMALLIGTLASPAHATRPARGCPPGFEALRTVQDIAEEGSEVTGLPVEAFLPQLNFYDKNDDNLLCFMLMPSGTRANVVDNTSNH
jgi:hypothetical protein